MMALRESRSHSLVPWPELGRLPPLPAANLPETRKPAPGSMRESASRGLRPTRPVPHLSQNGKPSWPPGFFRGAQTSPRSLYRIADGGPDATLSSKNGAASA